MNVLKLITNNKTKKIIQSIYQNQFLFHILNSKYACVQTTEENFQ